MSTYSSTQIVYTFSDSVGSAAGLSFDNSSGEGLATMQTYVTTVEKAVLADTTIQSLIGTDWTPVWGPVVYANDTSGATVIADNTMGCYYSPSNKLFVVAIAGTNPSSPFDWLDEDFDVHTLVPWTTAGGSGSGNISAGTNTGLQILLGMTSGGSTMLQALASYITTNSITGETIAVTGHSLGGALSPVLALYMHDNAATLGLSGQSLAAYPTAGPTPGDKDFAQTYEAVMSKAGGITYSSLYNTLDVIPCAWEEDLLATIPTIYDENIKPAPTDSPPDDFMGIVTCGLQLNALATLFLPYNPYTQVSTNRNPLTGTFNNIVDSDVQSKLQDVSLVLPSALRAYVSTLTNVARFAAQAVAQHTVAYPSLLNISDFDTEYQKILAANKPSSAAQIDGTNAAVARLTGLDLEAAAPLIAAAKR